MRWNGNSSKDRPNRSYPQCGRHARRRVVRVQRGGRARIENKVAGHVAARDGVDGRGRVSEMVSVAKRR